MMVFDTVKTRSWEPERRGSSPNAKTCVLCEAFSSVFLMCVRKPVYTGTTEAMNWAAAIDVNPCLCLDLKMAEQRTHPCPSQISGLQCE